MKKFLNELPVRARDAAGVAGAALIVYGVWQMHRPTALIIAGAMLLVASLLLARGDE